MKVFIVEDSDPVKRRLINAMSEMDGVEIVGHAESEWAAIQGILATCPDVAILDSNCAREMA